MKRISLSAARKYTQNLVARHMPRDILRLSPFDPNQYVLSIRSAVDGLTTRKLKKATQLQHLESVLEKPTGPGRSYVYVISSQPNDSKAKLVAAMIMERAIGQQLRGTSGVRGRTLPRWHVVNGSFQDILRDNHEEDKPSMLILSNIASDSTNVKIEKVRDLLEQFSSVPRIVVCTGTDPITFCNTRLRIAANFCLNIATGFKSEL